MAYILWQASGEKAHAQAVLVVIRDQGALMAFAIAFQPLLSWSYTRLASISMFIITSRACSSMGSLAWAASYDPCLGHVSDSQMGVVAAVGQRVLRRIWKPAIIVAFHPAGQVQRGWGRRIPLRFPVEAFSYCSQSWRNAAATVPRSSRKAAA